MKQTVNAANQRRLALKTVSGSALLGSLASKLPAAWQTAQAQAWEMPLVQIGDLPVHGQASAILPDTTATALPSVQATSMPSPTTAQGPITTVSAGMTTAAPTAAPTAPPVIPIPIPLRERWFDWVWQPTAGGTTYRVVGEFRVMLDGLRSDQRGGTKPITEDHIYYHVITAFNTSANTQLFTIDLVNRTLDGSAVDMDSVSHDFEFTIPAPDASGPSTFSIEHLARDDNLRPADFRVTDSNGAITGVSYNDGAGSPGWFLDDRTIGLKFALVRTNHDLSRPGITERDPGDGRDNSEPSTSPFPSNIERWFEWNWNLMNEGNQYQIRGEFRVRLHLLTHYQRIGEDPITEDDIYYHSITATNSGNNMQLFAIDLINRTLDGSAVSDVNHDFECKLPTAGATSQFSLDHLAKDIADRPALFRVTESNSATTGVYYSISAKAWFLDNRVRGLVFALGLDRTNFPIITEISPQSPTTPGT